MNRITKLAVALAISTATTSAANAAVTINFSFDGGDGSDFGNAGRPGVVKGRLIFDKTGKSVRPTSVTFLSATGTDLNESSPVDSIEYDYYSFDIDNDGIVTSAKIDYDIFSGDIKYQLSIGTSGSSALGYSNNYLAVINYSTGEQFVIGNTLSFAGVTFNPSPLVSAVPENSTWAMMLVGFSLIGGASRYRRRTKIAYA